MKNRTLPQGIALIILLFVIGSCKKKTTIDSSAKEVVYSEEIARHVSYVTSGNIYPDQPLEIIFIDDQVSEDMVGSDANQSILDITPKTKGKLIWKTAHILNFIPDDGWEMRENYSYQVILKNVSSGLADIKDELKAYFYVEGQELQYFQGELVLKERNSPKILKYIGKLTFRTGSKRT